MARPYQSDLVKVKAICQRCAWSSTSNNAQALAAQHFDSKRHLVSVETTTRITYGIVRGKHPEADRQGKML